MYIQWQSYRWHRCSWNSLENAIINLFLSYKWPIHFLWKDRSATAIPVPSGREGCEGWRESNERKFFKGSEGSTTVNYELQKWSHWKKVFKREALSRPSPQGRRHASSSRFTKWAIAVAVTKRDHFRNDPVRVQSTNETIALPKACSSRPPAPPGPPGFESPLCLTISKQARCLPKLMKLLSDL